MKVLISIFAMAIALAITGPAFAGPGSTITNIGRLREGRQSVG